MKTLKYSVFFSLLAMVALCLSGCGKNDGIDDGSGDMIGGKKTLKVDGEAYYCGSESIVQETNGNGMYLKVVAVEDTFAQWSGKELQIVITPSRVSELKVGDVFQSNDISVREFHDLSGYAVNKYSWDAVGGSVRISGISSTHLTIQIQQLVIEHHTTDAQHTIEGTASLRIQ